jgi:hypothetical protein
LNKGDEVVVDGALYLLKLFDENSQNQVSVQPPAALAKLSNQ